MSRWITRTAGLVGVGTVVGALVVGLAARRRWSAATERLVASMVGRSAPSRDTVSLGSLGKLPVPVRRYFETVLAEGRPLIRTVRIRQEGEFRSRESSDTEAGWAPFTAEQLFTTHPPGMVWDASIRMGPLLRVWVRDSYVAGSASMLGAVIGVVPVVNEADRAELRKGALQRYLAEAVWFPTALLPHEGLVWTPLDDTHARATLTDGATSVSLDFEFGVEGEIVSSQATRLRARPGEKGTYDELPWGGRYRRYVMRDGIRMPLESEVYWVVEGREQPYYRGRNVSVEFDPAD